eukprot:3932216-Prymnesium_polylepis.1
MGLLKYDPVDARKAVWDAGMKPVQAYTAGRRVEAKPGSRLLAKHGAQGTAAGAKAANGDLDAPLKTVTVLDDLEVDDHVILTMLNPLILDNTATVTPYHELCMSHDMLRETFQCLIPKPPPAGQAEVNYALGFKMGYPLGVWGGTCTCPDGRVYTAADNGDICGSLACFGGVAGECQQREGIWAFREVHCARLPPK